MELLGRLQIIMIRETIENITTINLMTIRTIDRKNTLIIKKHKSRNLNERHLRTSLTTSMLKKVRWLSNKTNQSIVITITLQRMLLKITQLHQE